MTEFFRDPALFDYLRTEILPLIIEDADRREGAIRLWSAGCATGEEAYSLAILVAEALGDRLHNYNVRIFATDLDADAIEFARHGVYSSEALANVDPRLVQQYFTQLDGEYQVRKVVRSLTVFGQHDLGERAPFPRIDLVLCRNVLIYFDPDLQHRVLQLIAFSLRDGGYLALGKSETTHPLNKFFVTENSELKVYQRRGERTAVPPASSIDSMLAPPTRPLVPRAPVFDVPQNRLNREMLRARAGRERSEQLFLRLPIGVVVVDQRYDIQLLNNAARQMLGIHSHALGKDLVHLAAGLPTREFRAAIDGALTDDETHRLSEVTVRYMPGGQARVLEVMVYGERDAGDDENTRATIVIEDVTEHVDRRRKLEEEHEQRQLEIERSKQLLQELIDNNEELLRANQELTAVNMELGSANEEFLVGNEELQAATEEVETLNEELQATNEELETLNEELQATVEELNTTNDDLQARSVELQDLAVSLEEERRASDTERARMAAILRSMGNAVLAVNTEGDTVLTNAAYERLFGGPNAPFVPEDDCGNPLPEEVRPQVRAARGESFTAEFTLAAEDGTRSYFEVVGEPIGGNGEREGGVLVIRDVTDRSLRRLQDEFLAAAGHELRTPLTVLDGYLSLMARNPPDDERSRTYLTLALQQARRLERLVRDLLDVSRLRTGKLQLHRETVDVAPLLRGAVEAIQSLTEHQTIQYDPGRSTPRVTGDASRLEQVFTNLLMNAVTHASESPVVEVTLRRVSDMAEVRIRDHGPGIAPAQIPTLFARFQSGASSSLSAKQGLGLGLYIAREIVQAHGGATDVESNPGEGATFIVRLPSPRRGSTAT